MTCIIYNNIYNNYYNNCVYFNNHSNKKIKIYLFKSFQKKYAQLKILHGYVILYNF